MGRNLTNLYISQSFEYLVQISGSELQNGLGSTLTGSLAITSSKADTATSASFATTASYVASVVSASYAVSASNAAQATTVYSTQTNANQDHYVTFVATTNDYENIETDNQLVYNPNTNLLTVTASYANNALSSSYSTNALSSSYAATAISSSFATNANNANTATSASFASTATSASYATNALSSSFAVTASYALNAGVTVNTGSLLTTASAVNNVITFTKGDGSTFPVTVNTGSAVTVNTGSLLVTASISNATTTFTKGDGSTFSITANNVVNADSASVAVASSYAISASQAQNAISASYVLNAVSASYADSALSSSYALTASFALNAPTINTASFATTGSNTFIGNETISGSLNVTGSVTGNVVGNNTDTYTSAPAVQQIVTLTQAEYNAIGSPDVNTLYIISGSLPINTGSFATTGSNTFIGNQIITGSFAVTGSIGGNVLGNNTDTYTSSAPIQQVVTLTQAEYNAISSSANANTFYVISDSTAFNPSNYATTGSNTFVGNQIISGSLTVTGEITGSIVSASYAATASYANSGFKVGELTISTPGTTNNDNTFVGRSAGFKISSDKNSTLIGSNAGYNLVGDDNVAVGLNALFGQIGTDSTGGQNTAVGTNAGLQIKLGNGNVALGYNAMYTVADFPAGADASFNTVIGNSAAKKLYYGDNNTIIGSLTAQLISTGSNNTIIGANYSGSDFDNTVVLTDGQGNVQFFATGGLATFTNVTASSINSVFTGSLLGTASFANTSTTASYVLNAVSSSFASTASFYDLSAVTQNAVFSGSVRGEVRALSISSQTASLDCSTDNFFTLTLVSGSTTFINPSNILPGQTINLRVKQASVASGSISFASSVKQVSGSAYTPTSTANGEDIITFISFDSTNLYLSNIKNFI